jgi:DNA-binding NarL/FixJ family response regulator
MKINTSIKTLVADDHKLFRSGIIKMLSDHQTIHIIAEAENGSELIERYFEVSPDIVLADIAMPQKSGLEAVSIIKEKDPEVKALFLSMYDNDEYKYKVLKSGGMGLINKNIMEGELTYAIEQVYKGERYFRGNWTKDKLESLVSEFESHNNQQIIDNYYINHREQQVLKMLTEGLTSQQMADKLELSKKTIDFYRSNIMRKFGLNSITELVRFALKYFETKEDFELKTSS